MYLGAADALDLKPGEVMMVASHKHDLRAAAQNGLKTAFIKRPHELGRNKNPDLEPEGDFTANAEKFLDLAGQLGARYDGEGLAEAVEPDERKSRRRKRENGSDRSKER